MPSSGAIPRSRATAARSAKLAWTGMRRSPMPGLCCNATARSMAAGSASRASTTPSGADACEERPGMPAAAEGAVEVAPARTRLQCRNRLRRGAQAGGPAAGLTSNCNGSRHDRHNPGQASRPRRRTVRAVEYAPRPPSAREVCSRLVRHRRRRTDAMPYTIERRSCASTTKSRARRTARALPRAYRLRGTLARHRLRRGPRGRLSPHPHRRPRPRSERQTPRPDGLRPSPSGRRRRSPSSTTWRSTRHDSGATRWAATSR